MSDAAAQIREIITRDGRYAPRAYEFLSATLGQVTRAVHGEPPYDDPPHVSGQQLSEGLRKTASDRWGPLAPAVLAHWNVRRMRDFGEMVFLLVNEGVMTKRDTDRIEDFDDGQPLATSLRGEPLDIDIAKGRSSP
ncbi:MAG: hypothetical protein KDA32_00710 [Phycisphaerales bacterium]|nr:hypothetical protein [Phycisphaerales bacterium]